MDRKLHPIMSNQNTSLINPNEFDKYSTKEGKIIFTKCCQNDEFYKIGHEFILKILKGFAKLSDKFINGSYNLSDVPYLYGEQQLSSLIMPTLSNICNGYVIAEIPTLRISSLKNHEKYNSSGRIDYWCIYNNYSFVIEIKHSYDCFRTSKTRPGKIIDKWETMTIEQLYSIQKDVKKYEEPTKGVIRVGLHFITSYTNKNLQDQEVLNYSKQIEDRLFRIQKDVCRCKPLKTSPNIAGCWLSKKIIKAYETTCPGVIIIGKIFEPVKHRGAI